MKRITHIANLVTWLMVEVPEGAKEFVNDKTFGWLHFLNSKGEDISKPLKLSDEKEFDIVALASDLTEDQERKIIEDCPHFAKCWKKYNSSYDSKNWLSSVFNPKMSCWTIQESFDSLLFSHDLKPETTLILKEVA